MLVVSESTGDFWVMDYGKPEAGQRKFLGGYRLDEIDGKWILKRISAIESSKETVLVSFDTEQDAELFVRRLLDGR